MLWYLYAVNKYSCIILALRLTSNEVSSTAKTICVEVPPELANTTDVRSIILEAFSISKHYEIRAIKSLCRDVIAVVMSTCRPWHTVIYKGDRERGSRSSETLLTTSMGHVSLNNWNVLWLNRSNNYFCQNFK